MMFVYHYVIIPFHPQYRHAPQGGGIQGGGIGGSKLSYFLYYHALSERKHQKLKEVALNSLLLDKWFLIRPALGNVNKLYSIYITCTKPRAWVSFSLCITNEYDKTESEILEERGINI